MVLTLLGIHSALLCVCDALEYGNSNLALSKYIISGPLKAISRYPLKGGLIFSEKMCAKLLHIQNALVVTTAFIIIIAGWGKEYFIDKGASEFPGFT